MIAVCRVDFVVAVAAINRDVWAIGADGIVSGAAFDEVHAGCGCNGIVTVKAGNTMVMS